MARGDATRRRLQEAAAQLIGEAGWSNVTTRMVAERAGVTPGVVHYHYASVTDLLIATSLGFVGELSARLGEELAARTSLGDGVDWLLAELDGYGGTDPASLLLVETYLASTRIPRLRDRLAEVIVGFRGTLAGWIAAHGRAADPEAAAAVLGAALDGLVLQRHLDPSLRLTELAGPLKAMLRWEEQS